MSKKKSLGPEDAIKDYDIGFNPDTSASKLPVDVSGGKQPLKDFMELPCDKIVEYQNKQGSDFTPWPEDRFEMLVEDIKKHGVIEPVTVRPLKGTDDQYEMLAGEHRWKACISLKKLTVPAHILRNCDDQTAADIFAVTNLLRRENSIRDKVNGWWHYTQAIYYKREGEIEKLIEEGIISQAIQNEASKARRQVSRYIRLHYLIDDLLDLIEQKRLSIIVGVELSYLTEDQQEDISVYKHNLNNLEKAKALRLLATGGVEGKTWEMNEVKDILFPPINTRSNSLTNVSKRVKKLIREKVPQEAYSEVEGIISKALDAYLEDHPELKKTGKKETNQM